MKYGKATQAVVLLAFVKRALCCIFLDPIFFLLIELGRGRGRATSQPGFNPRPPPKKNKKNGQCPNTRTTFKKGPPLLLSMEYQQLKYHAARFDQGQI